jgi:hypothetical protein
VIAGPPDRREAGDCWGLLAAVNLGGDGVAHPLAVIHAVCLCVGADLGKKAAINPD